MDYQVFPDAGFGEFPQYTEPLGEVGMAFGMFFGMFMVLYFVALLVGIAMYVMNAIALMRMAKKAGIRRGWLAFIPIGDIYMLGRIADAGKGKRTRTKMLMVTTVILFVLYILWFALIIGAAVSSPMADTIPDMFIPPLFIFVAFLAVAAICLAVFEYIAYYYICENFGGNSGAGYFIGILLGTFFMPIVSVILLLVLSGKQPLLADLPVDIPAVVAAEKTDSVF